MHAAILIPSPASLLSSSFLCQPAPKPIVTQKTAQKFVRLSIDAQAERDLDTDVFGGVSRHAFVHQLAIAAAAAPLLHDTGALAVQSSVVAGRIPGLSEPDSDGSFSLPCCSPIIISLSLTFLWIFDNAAEIYHRLCLLCNRLTMNNRALPFSALSHRL